MLVTRTESGKYRVTLYNKTRVAASVAQAVEYIMLYYRTWEGFAIPEGAYNKGRLL